MWYPVMNIKKVIATKDYEFLAFWLSAVEIRECDLDTACAVMQVLKALCIAC